MREDRDQVGNGLRVTRDDSRGALPVTRDENRDALRVTGHVKTDAIKSHKDLDVWKVSMDFVIELYGLTEHFPASEKFGLVMQLRRAGVSISSNIAEGAARAHSKEFVQFLYVSLGSVSEVETQLEIAFRLQYIDSIALQMNTLDRIRRMLIGLIKRVTRNP
jgi:four helix bundle protein